MALNFCTLSSSSKGNAIFVGTSNVNVLIDAGISCRRIEQSLISRGISPEKIAGIFLTHEHSDHTKGVALFSRKYNTNIYATESTIKKIQANAKKETDLIPAEKINYIKPNQKIVLQDLQLYSFSIPHDAEDPVGYTMFDGKSKISIATDLGHIPDKLEAIMKNSDIILLESNHDVQMVKEGIYPPVLKRRILGNYGHLSNHVAADFLTSIISPKLKHVFLGHLSQENNTPRQALETIHEILRSKGFSENLPFELKVAPAEVPGALICLE
jgi:phosphoribosyl 1,2-cyclic phosphodiesterase